MVGPQSFEMNFAGKWSSIVFDIDVKCVYAVPSCLQRVYECRPEALERFGGVSLMTGALPPLMSWKTRRNSYINNLTDVN